MRPIEPHQDAVVEPAEPAKLQELGPCHLEHKGGDGETDELGENQHPACGDPMLVGKQPKTEHATIHSTIGSRWRHSHASIKKTIAITIRGSRIIRRTA